MSKGADKLRLETERRKEAFDNFYRTIYNDRYEALREALLKEASPSEFRGNLKESYYMDRASVLVASLLPLKEDDAVLDMCAAPGGKSLVLLSRSEGRIFLTANDRSADRKQRLDNVLSEHVPEDWKRNIRTTCRDASTWGLHEKDAYDAVLLDAPCSSERHVLQSEKHMAMWSVSRPKRLAIEQYALLASALMAVKPGGYILYSTCSVNSAEDEGVIDKLMRRRQNEAEIIPFELEKSEERPYGRMIMPDTADNMGPLYACLIRKKNE
ncbi:MAG: RsmB/NOP family class I SAM-dependent RNA methyltransferase [Bullifex sp.]